MNGIRFCRGHHVNIEYRCDLLVLIDRISRSFPAVILVGLPRQVHHLDFVSCHKMGSERYD